MTPATKAKIPNAITMSRFGLSVVVFAMLGLFGPESPRWWLDVALAIFLAASLTDFVDGYLARKWQVVSVFGRVVDPFVDKILVLGTVIYLAGPTLGPISGFTPTVVVILLGRELLVTALRSAVEGRGKSFAAEWSGKVKMSLQCVAIALAMLYANHHAALDESTRTTARLVRDVFIWATVAVTIYSGIDYVRRAVAK